MGCVVGEEERKIMHDTIQQVQNIVTSRSKEIEDIHEKIIQKNQEISYSTVQIEHETMKLDLEAHYYHTWLEFFKTNDISSSMEQRMLLVKDLQDSSHLREQLERQRVLLESLKTTLKVVGGSFQTFKSLETGFDSLPNNNMQTAVLKTLEAQKQIRHNWNSHQPFVTEVGELKEKLTKDVVAVREEHEDVLAEYTLNMENKKKLAAINSQRKETIGNLASEVADYKSSVDAFMQSNPHTSYHQCNVTTQHHGGPAPVTPQKVAREYLGSYQSPASPQKTPNGIRA